MRRGHSCPRAAEALFFPHAVLANPVCQTILGQLTRCDREDSPNRVRLIRQQFEAVQRQKEADGQKPGAFVAVAEGMVADNAEAVSRSKTGDISIPFIGVNMLRTGQRRFQGCLIQQSRQPPVLGQCLGMQEPKRPRVDPFWRPWTLHFASARKASRYVDMNSRPLSNCRSTSGS